MHNLNIGAFENDGMGMGKSSAENTPPPWHGAESGPVVLRSLLHDPDAASEHRHDDMELILNFGTAPGSVVWREGEGAEKTAPLDAEHCCLIPAGVSHLVNGLRECGAVSLLLGGALLAEPAQANMTEVVVGNVRHLTAHDTLAGGLAAEFGRTLARRPHVPMVGALGVALALKLLDRIAYQEDQYTSARPAFAPSEQARILDCIRESLGEGVRVGELSRRLGLSRAQFTRRFRVTFGLSPLQYALKMRVDRALELLRGGEYRVAEAAYAVGFYDQSHLDRHCRKFYGHSPSAMLRAQAFAIRSS